MAELIKKLTLEKEGRKRSALLLGHKARDGNEAGAEAFVGCCLLSVGFLVDAKNRPRCSLCQL